MLYIGDDPYDDVLGADRMGISVILLDGRTPPPPNVRLPEPMARIADGDTNGVARVARAHFGLPD